MKQNLKNVRCTDIQLNNILIIISSLAIDRLSRQKNHWQQYQQTLSEQHYRILLPMSAHKTNLNKLKRLKYYKIYFLL